MGGDCAFRAILTQLLGFHIFSAYIMTKTMGVVLKIQSGKMPVFSTQKLLQNLKLKFNLI